MQLSTVPPANGYRPATYRERGLAVSFTSPKLVGARVRAFRNMSSLSAEARSSGQCVEIIVPSWVDRRGVYAVPWPAAKDLFRPTVHDVRLGETLVRLVRDGGALGPLELWRLTRVVGRDGFAGRAIASGSMEALAKASRREEATFAVLVRELARQKGLAKLAEPDIATVTGLVAGRMDWPVTELASVLRLMSAHFAQVGVGGNSSAAPLPSLVAQIRELQCHAGDLAREKHDPATDAWAHLDQNARIVTTIAEKAIAMVRARLAGLADLLAGARADRDGSIDELQRPAWILDGWDAITLRWRMSAGDADPEATATELAALVPPLPDELDRWLQLPVGTAAKATKGSRPAGTRPARPLEPDAATLDQIARNEHILAMAA